MKKLASLIMSVALVSSAFAGSPVVMSSKNAKTPMAPQPTGCACFAPGASFGVYGGGILNSTGGDDSLGGGVLADYFFCENFGIQGSYGVFATQSEHHEFDAAFVLRAPIKSLCIAPYALIGGGFSTNSENRGNFLVGGGIEARLSSAGNLGIFADGAYHFASEGSDYTIVRLGVKFPL